MPSLNAPEPTSSGLTAWQRMTSGVEKFWSSALGRSAILAVLLTVFSKGIGFVRELLVASSIGVDSRLDAFHVAVIIPTFAINILNQNVASSLVVRVVRERTQNGVEAGNRLYEESLFWGALCSLVVSVLGALLGPALLPVLAPGFTPEQAAAMQTILWWLVPYSTLSGISIYWSSMLNLEGSVVASSLNPGVVSGGVVLSLGLGLGAGIESLILGLTAGTLFGFLFLGRAIQQRGLFAIPRRFRWEPPHTGILLASLPLIASSILHFGTEVADQSMASWLGEGSISELKYGNRIVGMLFGIVSIPISQVLFPRLIHLAESSRWSELQAMTRRATLGTLLFSLPFTLGLVLFSSEIVSLMFQRGKFTPESTMQVAAIQAMYAFQLPFYLWGIVLVRVAVALGMKWQLVVGSTLNLTINVTMNYLLMKPLGATGIALSTAIVYLGAACYFSAAIHSAMKRKLRESHELSQLATEATQSRVSHSRAA